jgi:hypothetical protein
VGAGVLPRLQPRAALATAALARTSAELIRMDISMSGEGEKPDKGTRKYKFRSGPRTYRARVTSQYVELNLQFPTA